MATSKKGIFSTVEENQWSESSKIREYFLAQQILIFEMFPLWEGWEDPVFHVKNWILLFFLLNIYYNNLNPNLFPTTNPFLWSKKKLPGRERKSHTVKKHILWFGKYSYFCLSSDINEELFFSVLILHSMTLMQAICGIVYAQWENIMAQLWGPSLLLTTLRSKRYCQARFLLSEAFSLIQYPFLAKTKVRLQELHQWSPMLRWCLSRACCT